MDEALKNDHRSQLLDMAQRSIEFGMRQSEPLEPAPDNYPAPLCQERATFVTLRNHSGDLRGCIGVTEPRRALVSDVAHNAFSAAFRDPRFPPLTEAEYRSISMEISVLSPAELLHADSEQQLLARLRPGVDGIILHAGPNRATFLPSVWESLPEPKQFLSELKRKAGITANTPDTILYYRYTTTSFSRP